ncbi:Nn.00g115520.m01.CDS01 [Neocucurbitaria sp. VM-36]
MSRLFLLFLLATLFALTIGQKCYGLDGTALDDTFAPCNPSAKHSGCCATKRTTGSVDLCLDNGLCMGTTNEFMGTIWQNGCTDPTGKDAACPRMCPDASNDFNGLNPVTAWNIQICDYGEYCCRAINDQRSCCNNATAPKVTTTFLGALQVLASSTSEPTRVVGTAVSTGTPFSATTAPDQDVCKKEKRKTAIVGGTVGSLFGAVILGLVGTILLMYKKEKRQRKLKEHYEEQFSQTNAYRKALASSAGSIRESVFMEELKVKSSGPD